MGFRQMWHAKLLRLLVLLVLLVIYCEFLHYYIVLIFCTWPALDSQFKDIFVTQSSHKPLKAMFIADTHLLGSRDGHWFDKLRREWQMQRTFQTSLSIHSPDVVFVLGDLFDEGKWSSDKEFQYHVDRFKKMFHHSKDISFYAVVGNHDIGFHYDVTIEKHERFQKAFDAPSVKVLRIRDSVFVLLNSMAMQNDGCTLCSEALRKIYKVSQTLKCWQFQGYEQVSKENCKNIEILPYSRPIILQHFPMYRPSDFNCTTPDAAPEPLKSISFQENFDCLSQSSTKQIFKLLNPRLIMSGHTHHGCYRVHSDGTPEWTVASFSWRNKKAPTFLLALITSDNFAVHQCAIPKETTVIYMYILGSFLALFSLFLPRTSIWRPLSWTSVNKDS
ncbi:metallophosphoesterase 1 [Octopus vulgaris]|uniref:Metallophosphoesterase 1 n=1 Tax=Octopus vulgaris TaxID=6645 RepID=A0AA36BPM2_OCTVU|nr:metallophosphoesterase 1 [Octopus vulgaris]